MAKKTTPVKSPKATSVTETVAAAAGVGFSLDEIKEVIILLRENGVTEFELTKCDSKLSLKRQGAPVAPAPVQSFQPGAYSAPMAVETPALAVQAPAAPKANLSVNLHSVNSPMVGTFYKKPSPDAPAFVSVGDMVKKGQTICIIEAMKVMNEIEADASGRVVEICLDDAQIVEFGEALIKIDPS